MALRIVTDGPRRSGARRLARAMAVLLAALLLPLALLAGAVSAVFLTLLLTIGDRRLDPNAVLALVGLGAASIVILLVALRLLRGKRRLALFLRRFGLVDATEAVTTAVATAMGRRWRVVTLDDDRIAPVGVPRATRSSLATLAVVGTVVLVAGFVWFASSGGLDGLVDAALEGVAEQMSVEPEEGASFGEVVEALFASVIGAAIAVMVTALVVLLFVSFLLVVFVFAGATGALTTVAYARARRAERAGRSLVTTQEEIARVAHDLRARSGRIFGARLTVLRVAHAVWRQAVEGLADVAAVVVIDVSDPTDNLLWEIETLQRRADIGWVLIGERSRLDALVGTQRGLQRDDAVVQRFLVLLDGQTVLAYEHGRPASLHFARALRASLDAAA